MTNAWHKTWTTVELKTGIRNMEHRILVLGKTDEQHILDEMCRELGTREEC